MKENISIIIPCFNDGEELQKLLSSLFEQTYTHFEIILVDGGSTDNTFEIYNKYKSKISKFISEKDFGIFDAMNKGIALAEGDWLFFIGCDDRLMDQNVLHNIFFEKNYDTIDILYGKIYNKFKDQTLGVEINNKNDLLQNLFWHQSIFYRKKVFELVGNYKLKYKIAADTVFNLDAYCNHNLIWHFMDQTITRYSGVGLSSSTIDIEYHKDQRSLYFLWFKGISNYKIYYALQFHLYNEVRFGNLYKAIKEYIEIIIQTKQFRLITINSLYWFKMRIKSSF